MGKGKLATVLCCDANAHNILWSSKDTNLRGKCLITFSNKNREAVIYLTLTSSSFVDQIVKWKVVEDDSFSDPKMFSLVNLF